MVNHMSRTDNTLPNNIRALDIPDWARTENHYWCENETVDTAHYSRYRDKARAVYEREIVKYVDVEVEYVKMIDSNKVKFDAEYVTDWRRGRMHTYVYDREEHPGAEPYTYPFFYGGEIWNVRSFKKEIVSTPVYRNRLVYWEWEPRRECDIDTPGGVCYYLADFHCSCRACTNQNGKRLANKSRRRRTKTSLTSMVHDYNTFGEVGDDPPTRHPEDSRW